MDSIVGKTLKGMTQSVLVEEDAITISYRALYHGFKGDKRLPYSSITSVQYREAGSWLAGYLQLNIKGATEWQGAVGQDENAIQFDKGSDDFGPLRDFINARIAAGAGGTAPASVADELAKLADLRDQGILTDDEFAAQKARLLG